MFTSGSYSLSLPCLILVILSITAKATVSPSKTFKYINQGKYGEYGDLFRNPNEYNANYRVLDISSRIFLLCFYNTTPGAYTLGLRMGSQPTDNPVPFRWVWAANRESPVGENATLSLGTDGNLVLAQADGKIAWQTGTANKGVVGHQLLPNGNLVLVDGRGRFVWQSFDHPSDTLLVGQGLHPNGPTKLVSRVSNVDGSEGLYSYVLENKRLALYMKSKNSPKPLLYYTTGDSPPYQGSSPTIAVVFNVSADRHENNGYELRYEFMGQVGWTDLLARPKYNSTYSFLRLESDGNVKIYTFFEHVEWGPWEVTYSLFGILGAGSGDGCKLPTKCGSFGLCDKQQCVACPRPKGLKGWSESCAPPRLPHCKNGVSVSAVEYYKVGGVEHFLSDFSEGEGPISVDKCKEKCSRDCGCLGVLYKEESSKCLLTPELGTFSKLANRSHVAYIKIPKYAKLTV